MNSPIYRLVDLRVFGVFFALVFALLGFKINAGPIWELTNILISVLFLIATLVRPIVLKTPYIYWLWISKKVSQALTPLELGIVYFIILTPFSIFYRLSGKKIRKFNNKNSVTSTWRSDFVKIDKDYFGRAF